MIQYKEKENAVVCKNIKSEMYVAFFVHITALCTLIVLTFHEVHPGKCFKC